MDREALLSVYVSCGAAVERRCRALLGDDPAVPDLVQEVFLRASIDGAFRGESAPFTWLYRVSTNLCLNHLRDRKRTLPIDALLGREGGLRPDAKVHARRELEDLVRGLDRRTLAVVVYHFLDEMPQEEIAEVTGWSRKTVGKKLAAFRARLGDEEAA